MTAPERLTSLDASFLYLEGGAMHMHVAGLSVFEPKPDGTPLRAEDVERTLRDRMHLAPRLRQKIQRIPLEAGRPVWVDDDRFELEFHVQRTAVPPPHDRSQLERAVGRILSRPLDRTHPLWKLYVFEGLEDDRTALLLKLHHAMTDGIAGMQIASALFDLAPDVSAPVPSGAWSPSPRPTPAELVRDAVIDQIQHPVEAVLHAAEAPARVADLVSRTASGVRAIVGMGRTPSGPFDAAIGPNRRFATTEAPFERIRRVKAALGGTINDVVLTAIAGGLHDVLRSRSEPTRGRSLRVMVPVSVRGEHDPQLGNRVAPAFVDVPVGAMRPERRLRAVRKATVALKASSMAESAESIIELGAFAPPALHAAAARLASRGRWFNLVVSNVPAPQVPLYLAGARLVANYPSIPLNGNVALSIACTSLGGTMAFGLTADWDAVPDLDVLTRGIEGSIDELEKAAADRAR